MPCVVRQFHVLLLLVLCAYLWRNSHDELTQVARYTPRWFTRPYNLPVPVMSRPDTRATMLVKTCLSTNHTWGEPVTNRGKVICSIHRIGGHLSRRGITGLLSFLIKVDILDNGAISCNNALKIKVSQILGQPGVPKMRQASENTKKASHIMLSFHHRNMHTKQKYCQHPYFTVAG